MNTEDVFARGAGAGSRGRARLAVAVLAGAVAVALLALPAGAQAQANNVNVKVMTRNLYLGADLTPAIQAASSNDFVDANGQIVRDVDTNNFPTRAKGLAQEILQKKPDLVGLQEVSLWRKGPSTTAPPSPATAAEDDNPPFGCNFTASTVRYDYLTDLMQQLNKDKQALQGRDLPAGVRLRGAHRYNGVPGDGDSPANMNGEENDRLTMRDVILKRLNSGVDDDERQGRALPPSVRAPDRRPGHGSRLARLDPGRRDRSRQPQVPVREHPSGGVRRSDHPPGSGQGAGPARWSGDRHSCR